MISTQSHAERAAAVLVDELEAALGGGKELASKFGDFFHRGLALRLARRGALLELVRERLLDALLPLVRVDGAVVIRVHLRERGLEARRDQQVLQVFVAAVGQKLDNLPVRPDGGHL